MCADALRIHSTMKVTMPTATNDAMPARSSAESEEMVDDPN